MGFPIRMQKLGKRLADYLFPGVSQRVEPCLIDLDKKTLIITDLGV